MKNDPVAEVKRLLDLVNEAALASTILRYARSGNATILMVEQAIELIARHVGHAKEINDQSWLRSSEDLKAGLEQALIEGVESLRVVQGPGREYLEVEDPVAFARLAAGHHIRRQKRCAGGIIDIYDLTADELIECKFLGTSAALGEAAGQLHRYSKSFPGASLTIAVLRIEAEAEWLAAVLAGQGIRIIEIERGIG